MTIGAALVLFAVVWFMILFIVLPLYQPSQAEDGDVAPGTSPSAPANPQLGKRALIVTALSVVVWAIIVAVITTGAISLETMNIWGGIKP
jgi:predicted secreted protein